MNSFLKTMAIIIILSLGSSHHTQAMWQSIVYHCTPASWAVQGQIDSAIKNAKDTAPHIKLGIAEKGGKIKGISWSVTTVKKESGDFFIQVTCSDPVISKMYQDKGQKGLL